MSYKFNWWLFSLLVFFQLQLDLLCFKLGLQGLVILNLIWLIYSKKIPLFKISLALLAFSVEKFITGTQLLTLELSLLLAGLLVCQILKRNLLFKAIIFYFVLIAYLVLNYYLACNYFFDINFRLTDLIPQLVINLIYGTIVLKFYPTD